MPDIARRPADTVFFRGEAMHTCEDCIFCHYRKARIAAFGAAASGRHGADAAQPFPSTPPVAPPADGDDALSTLPQSKEYA
jgi:hypothetical protein